MFIQLGLLHAWAFASQRLRSSGAEVLGRGFSPSCVMGAKWYPK